MRYAEGAGGERASAAAWEGRVQDVVEKHVASDVPIGALVPALAALVEEALGEQSLEVHRADGYRLGEESARERITALETAQMREIERLQTALRETRAEIAEYEGMEGRCSVGHNKRLTYTIQENITGCVACERDEALTALREREGESARLRVALIEIEGKLLYSSPMECPRCAAESGDCECLPTCETRSDNHAAALVLTRAALAAPTNPMPESPRLGETPAQRIAWLERKCEWYQREVDRLAAPANREEKT